MYRWAVMACCGFIDDIGHIVLLLVLCMMAKLLTLSPHSIQFAVLECRIKVSFRDKVFLLIWEASVRQKEILEITANTNRCGA